MSGNERLEVRFVTDPEIGDPSAYFELLMDKEPVLAHAQDLEMLIGSWYGVGFYGAVGHGEDLDNFHFISDRTFEWTDEGFVARWWVDFSYADIGASVALLTRCLEGIDKATTMGAEGRKIGLRRLTV